MHKKRDKNWYGHLRDSGREGGGGRKKSVFIEEQPLDKARAGDSLRETLSVTRILSRPKNLTWTSEISPPPLARGESGIFNSRTRLSSQLLSAKPLIYSANPKFVCIFFTELFELYILEKFFSHFREFRIFFFLHSTPRFDVKLL